jgi:hypothetical protein
VSLPLESFFNDGAQGGIVRFEIYRCGGTKRCAGTFHAQCVRRPKANAQQSQTIQEGASRQAFGIEVCIVFLTRLLLYFWIVVDGSLLCFPDAPHSVIKEDGRCREYLFQPSPHAIQSMAFDGRLPGAGPSIAPNHPCRNP